MRYLSFRLLEENEREVERHRYDTGVVEAQKRSEGKGEEVLETKWLKVDLHWYLMYVGEMVG